MIVLQSRRLSCGRSLFGELRAGGFASSPSRSINKLVVDTARERLDILRALPMRPTRPRGRF